MYHGKAGVNINPGQRDRDVRNRATMVLVVAPIDRLIAAPGGDEPPFAKTARCWAPARAGSPYEVGTESTSQIPWEFETMTRLTGFLRLPAERVSVWLCGSLGCALELVSVSRVKARSDPSYYT